MFIINYIYNNVHKNLKEKNWQAVKNTVDMYVYNKYNWNFIKTFIALV